MFEILPVFVTGCIKMYVRIYPTRHEKKIIPVQFFGSGRILLVIDIFE
jgi:hypothetical protein